MEPRSVDRSSWSALEHSLAVTLGALREDGFVVVEPAAARSQPERRTVLQRLFRTAQVDSGPFVQARAGGGHVYVECVGTRSLGGRHAWTPAQEARLTQVGWVHVLLPFGDPVYVPAAEEPDGWLGRDAVPRAARLMVATMRDVVGVAQPASVDITVG